MSERKRVLIQKGMREMEKAQAEQPPEEIPAAAKETPREEPQEQPLAYRPLIYLSFPSFGYGDSLPGWYAGLDSALRKQGYLTYCPNKPVVEQFRDTDFLSLGILPCKIMSGVCPLLNLPEEVLLPFSEIVAMVQRSDHGYDNSAAVFVNLWFLARSALLIADLERPMVGAETAGELVYAKLMNVPAVGLLPGSGALSPWSQHLATLLFTDKKLSNILPIIQGYAPQV